MCVDDIPPDIVLREKNGCTVFSFVKIYMNKMLFDEQLPLKRKPLKGEMNNKKSFKFK